MTIKQQGGIFGRNPSFNDVEANDIDAQTVKLGNLTNGRVALSGVDGLVTDNSTLTYDGLNAQVAGGTSRGGFVAKSDLNIAGLYMKTATANNRGAAAEFLAHNDGLNSIGWRISNSYDTNGDWNLHFGVSGATSDYSAISYTDVAYFNSNGLAFPNGKGIDFSATSGTGTSELFNDYEEGAWTPVFRGSVSDPTVVGTVSGVYTRVGRLVTFTLEVITSSVTGGSGTLTISGLPFTTIDRVVCGGATVNFTLGMTVPSKAAYPISNTTSISLLADNFSNTSSTVADLAVGNNYLFIAGQYFV